jgi:hypothetical protein
MLQPPNLNPVIDEDTGDIPGWSDANSKSQFPQGLHRGNSEIGHDGKMKFGPDAS